MRAVEAKAKLVYPRQRDTNGNQLGYHGSIAALFDPRVKVVSDDAQQSSALAMVRYSHATSELLRRHPLPMIKKHMRIPLAHFDCRLVVLSSFIVIAAAYVTLVVVDRMKVAQGMAWFAWLGGGASGIGVGIWLMHYFGWRAFTMTAPTFDRSSVICSIVATIFASGLTLLVVSGRSDSGRRVKEENQCPTRPEILQLSSLITLGVGHR